MESPTHFDLSKTCLILGGSNNQSDESGFIRKLYRNHTWQALRKSLKYDEIADLRIFALSEKHGLLHESEVKAPYTARLVRRAIIPNIDVTLDELVSKIQYFSTMYQIQEAICFGTEIQLTAIEMAGIKVTTIYPDDASEIMQSFYLTSYLEDLKKETPNV